jgi:hypothetical protein
MGVYPIYVEPTPYNAEELEPIDYAQAFDTIYLAHKDYPFSKFLRNDHDDWAYSVVAVGPTQAAPTSVSATATNPNVDAANSGDGYFPQLFGFCVSAVNTDGQESRASSIATATNDTELPRNYTTITWAAAASADFYRIYKQHEGGSFGFIGETEGTSFKDDGFSPSYQDAPIYAYDPISTTGNYPGRVGFWEQRLWAGGTNNLPNGLFASRSSDFENFDVARPLRENDAIAMAISTGKVDAIEALVPLGQLVVPTSDNIIVLNGPNDGILTPNPPPGATVDIKGGISRPSPVVTHDAAFYQPRVENGVRSIGYQFEANGFRSNNVNIFCPHLFKDRRIVAWAYASEPYSVIYCVMDDGDMLAFTWEKEQDIWGWTEIDVNGFVEDVIAIPEGNEDRVYIIVRRTINGSERRFVERFGTAKWTNYAKAYFLDCARGQTYVAATQIITGLGHLEGETISVLADGTHLTKTVTNASIDLGEGYASFDVIVGIPYDVIIETLPLGADARKKITGRIYTDVVNSFDWQVGREETRLEWARTRDGTDFGAPTMYTGKVEHTSDQSVDQDGTVIVKQTTPYPLSLTGIYYDAAVK